MPRVSWEMNLNTLLSIAGFVIMLATGYGAYTSFRAETEAWRDATVEQLNDVKTQRAADVARSEARADQLENSINALNIQDARQIEQIAAMLVYLQRIDRTLEQLADKDRKQDGP